MERRHPNVVNLQEVETVEIEKGRRFLARSKALARAAHGAELAANWFEVPPGKTAFQVASRNRPETRTLLENTEGAGRP